MLVVFGGRSTQDAVANGDTRTLSFHHTHTDETATITFKRNGRYDDEGMKQLNWLLRDWRRDEPTKMDPHLFDIVWEVYREVGGKAPIRVVSAYRSPATNSMLRSRGRGVAKFSQHMLGKAMDFYIPDADLDDIRDAGLRLQRGGVGWYPTSGSPFVHLDTGTVRHWPRMSRDVLARVFPDGKTVHVPSDGRPLSGYEVAAREVETRGGSVRGRTQVAARADDDVEAGDDGSSMYTGRAAGTGGERRSLFAWLTGERDAPRGSDAPPAPRIDKPVAIVAPPPAPAQPSAAAEVPLPVPRPVQVAVLPPPRPSTLSGAPSRMPLDDDEAAVPNRPAMLVADAHQAIAHMPPLTIQPQLASGPPPIPPAPIPGVAPLRPGVEPAGNETKLAALPQTPPAGPASPTLRWVTGPSGQPLTADAAAGPKNRPGRESGQGAGGFALASAASTPFRPAPGAADTTASVTRDLPAVITQGPNDTRAADAPVALAYAVPGDNSLPRSAPGVQAPVTAVPTPQPPAAEARAPAARAASRDAAREAPVRMVAPRADGPGLPRMITAVRIAAAATDLRYPDPKAAAVLLRSARGVIDERFSRAGPDLSSDSFAGPAIRPLPVARFDVAAR